MNHPIIGIFNMNHTIFNMNHPIIYFRYGDYPSIWDWSTPRAGWFFFCWNTKK